MNNKMVREKQQISSKNMPGAIDACSWVIFGSSSLLVSSRMRIAADGVFENSTAAAHAHLALTNIGILLNEAGLDFSNIMKSTVLPRDIGTYCAVNDAYEHFFPDPKPARAATAVNMLPKYQVSKFELEVIAIKD